MKEVEVGQAIESFLVKEGWDIERNVCGVRGVYGPDILATKDGVTLCLEAKGHAGNDGVDFKTAIGQLVINMCDNRCIIHALAVPKEGYGKQVTKCKEWYRKEGVRVFLIHDNGEVTEI